MKLTLTVNGQPRTIDVPPDTRLLDALRDDMGIHSTRSGCDVGFCGACTVLVDGEPFSSCLMLAAQAQGRELTTVDGLANNGDLHAAQQAFIEKVGFQCAYCTPGFILSAVALIEAQPDISDDDIEHGMAGNLCRCGSYVNIVEAVKAYRDHMNTQ